MKITPKFAVRFKEPDTNVQPEYSADHLHKQVRLTFVDGMMRLRTKMTPSEARTLAANLVYMADRIDHPTNAENWTPPIATVAHMIEWSKLIYDNGYSLGDRLQRLSSAIGLVLGSDFAVRPHEIREQSNDQ